MKNITMPRKSAAKKQMKKRVQRKRRTVAKSPANSGKVVEFFDLGTFETNQSYDFVVNGIIPYSQPGQKSRAALTAEAFGMYRIAQVEYKITPKFDTYSAALVPGGDSPTEVPKLFWKINRYGDDIVGFNMQNMQSLGCKPIRLDDNTVTIKYKPNILLSNTGDAAQGLGGGSGNIKMTPWLNTNRDPDALNWTPSTTEHVGHLMYIEAGTTGDGVGPVCEITCRVVYEFKNPRIVDPAAFAKRPHVKVAGNVKTQVLTLEEAIAMNTARGLTS